MQIYLFACLCNICCQLFIIDIIMYSSALVLILVAQLIYTNCFSRNRRECLECISASNAETGGLVFILGQELCKDAENVLHLLCLTC